MSAADRWAIEGSAERTLADDEQGEAPTRPKLPGRPVAVEPPTLSIAPIAEKEPRRPLDLDQVQEVAWTVVGAALYLFGIPATAIALTFAFAGWIGCALVLVAGGIPAGYTLVKAAGRRAERERRAALRESQERTATTGAVDIPVFP